MSGGWRKVLGGAVFGLPVIAVVAAVLVSASPGAGAGAAEALPDLVSDPPDHDFLSTYSDASGTRLLLRFDGYVHNDGQGAVDLRGSGNTGGLMATTFQRIYATDGSTSRDVAAAPAFVYETNDSHNHWHAKAAMRYSLYDGTKSSMVAPAMKVGFCLVDTERVGPHGPTTPGYVASSTPPPGAIGSFCQQGHPEVSSVAMGVSPGWRDIYVGRLAFQWVDVSDVTPGAYWLASEADPDRRILEANEANNGPTFAARQSIVPGWLARPVTANRPATGAVTVNLAADAFGTPGPVVYRIVSGPSRGTLSVGAGSDVTGSSTVVYTPAPNSTGGDSFVFSARDATSPYPVHPRMATVTIANGTPSVTISGVPAAVTVGTSARLTAIVAGDPPAVTWSVDGVIGGATGVGTITPAGLYTAPTTVPAGGSVTIRATTASATATASIAIAAAAAPTPAPQPAGSGGGGGGGGAAPDLELTVSADSASAPVGGTVLLRLHTRQKNVGLSSGASATTVTTVIPEGLELVSSKVNRGAGCTGTRTITCPLDFLAGDLTGEVELLARVVRPGTFTTSATLESNPADANPADNTVTVETGTGSAPAALTPPTAPKQTGPKPQAKPKPRAATGARLLSGIAVGRDGRQILVNGVTGAAGTVAIRASRPGMAPVTCELRTPSSRAFTCAIELSESTSFKGLTVSVVFRRGGVAAAARRLTLTHRIGVARDGVETWG